jgi:hypothetical protein
MSPDSRAMTEPAITDANEAACASGPRPSEVIDTAAAAALMGLTAATLRNYAWLQSMSKRERKERVLQAPPSGMPRPKRVRGRLQWKRQDVESFIAQQIQGT